MRPATDEDRAAIPWAASALSLWPATEPRPFRPEEVREFAREVGLRFPVSLEPISHKALVELSKDRQALGGYFGNESIARREHVLRFSPKVRDRELLTLILYHELIHARQNEEGRLERERGRPAPPYARKLGGGQWTHNLMEYEAWTRSARLANRRLGTRRTPNQWLEFLREHVR